jgi:excisionase family DNA binding protein
MVEQDSYTPSQAARVLGLTDRHVRHMLDGGELEGEKAENGRWSIPQHAVHRKLEEKRRRLPAGTAWYGGVYGAEEVPQARQEAAELRVRVEDLQRTLGRLEGRLELTERAESTMQEHRDRLIEDLERERERAERLERELSEARDTLEARSRPWWRRMFGG